MSFFEKLKNLFRDNSSIEELSKEPVIEFKSGNRYPHINGFLPKSITEMNNHRSRGNYNTKSGKPSGIVWHHAASRNGAEGVHHHAVKSGFKYHTIDQEGNLILSLPLNKWGYHAGRSYSPQLGHGLSAKLDGVEVTSAGLLNSKKETWWGERVADACVRFAQSAKDGGWSNVTKSGYYEKFSKEAEACLEWLTLYLRWQHGEDFKYLRGHDEVAVNYKKNKQGKYITSSVNEKNYKQRLGRKNDPGGSSSRSMDGWRERLGME